MKPTIYKVIKTTVGKFHSWCNSSVGLIRKPNNALPDETDKLVGIEEIELRWWDKLWNWILKLFNLIKR